MLSRAHCRLKGMAGRAVLPVAQAIDNDRREGGGHAWSRASPRVQCWSSMQGAGSRSSLRCVAPVKAGRMHQACSRPDRCLVVCHHYDSSDGGFRSSCLGVSTDGMLRPANIVLLLDADKGSTPVSCFSRECLLDIVSRCMPLRLQVWNESA